MNILVSQKAPDFTGPAVLANGEIEENFNLREMTRGRYTLLFFYPLDFTFVCPSELLALNKRIATFKEKNVEVLGISIDSQFTHLAWRNTPIEKGGIGPLKFTLISDLSHNICKSYGVQHPDAKVAFRAAFILDAQGIVRAEIVNDLPLGRNIDEILRLIDALQFHEKHGEVCPAGWNTGDDGMQATPKGVIDYLKMHAEKL